MAHYDVHHRFGIALFVVLVRRIVNVPVTLIFLAKLRDLYYKACNEFSKNPTAVHMILIVSWVLTESRLVTEVNEVSGAN